MNKNTTKALVYEDLVGKHVHARLYDAEHPEWQRCKVVAICKAGLKVKSMRTKTIHIVGNCDVPEDVRMEGAFVPWEVEQQPYDGAINSIRFSEND